MIVNYYISKLKQQKLSEGSFESSDSFSDALLMRRTYRTNE